MPLLPPGRGSFNFMNKMKVMKNLLNGATFVGAAFLLFAWSAVFARELPGRNLSAPDTVSPEMAALISAPVSDFAFAKPQNAQEWQKLVQEVAENSIKALPALKEHLQVKTEPITLNNVPAYMVEPAEISPANKDRILLHFHGGGYVLNPGEAGLSEAIQMAHHGKIKVVSVDYRMAPEHPYPAAMDDGMAVYEALLKDYPAEKIGVFGTSTGGGMTLALGLRAKAAGLPLPGALAPGTPWTDLTSSGDTYNTNEYIDNILGGYDGWLGEAAKAYAGSHDLREPFLSPVYGDVNGFPPVLLTSGTRDLFLSNTVRMQKKLREANVPTDLLVHEALPHAAYYMLPDSPEAQYHFKEHAKFFDKWLK